MTRKEKLHTVLQKFRERIPKVYPGIDTIRVKAFWDGRRKIVLEWRKTHK